mmetsp:Transcript_12111/g.42170  ORF Transcript_12111/g.42170 Transcript_12111/m.42170 type:complete len:288 (-) Transcript_12111:5640-6503(-)
MLPDGLPVSYRVDLFAGAALVTPSSDRHLLQLLPLQIPVPSPRLLHRLLLLLDHPVPPARPGSLGRDVAQAAHLVSRRLSVFGQDLILTTRSHRHLKLHKSFPRQSEVAFNDALLSTSRSLQDDDRQTRVVVVDRACTLIKDDEVDPPSLCYSQLFFSWLDICPVLYPYVRVGIHRLLLFLQLLHAPVASDRDEEQDQEAEARHHHSCDATSRPPLRRGLEVLWKATADANWQRAGDGGQLERVAEKLLVEVAEDHQREGLTHVAVHGVRRAAAQGGCRDFDKHLAG